MDFYPRSPCGERRDKKVKYTSTSLFLSTLSLRRATVIVVLHIVGGADFYPRSPCGERRRLRAIHNAKINISIHALLAESDSIPFIRSSAVCIFLSTLSLRRATGQYCESTERAFISIHALLAESDVIRKPATSRNNKFLSTLSLRRATRSLRQLQSALRHFYPRSPCGERP